MDKTKIKACHDIGGMIMDKNCLINNDFLDDANMQCEELGGFVHEIPHNARVSRFICEFPLDNVYKITEEIRADIKKIVSKKESG